MYRDYQQLKALDTQVLQMLDRAVEIIKVSQSTEKGVLQGFVCGDGSRINNRALLFSGDGDNHQQGFIEARYLGPYLHYKHSFALERQRRILAADKAWYAFGSFWFISVDFKMNMLPTARAAGP